MPTATSLHLRIHTLVAAPVLSKGAAVLIEKNDSCDSEPRGRGQRDRSILHGPTAVQWRLGVGRRTRTEAARTVGRLINAYRLRTAVAIP